MPSSSSIVISCAGVGSRLGLATTKALIKIEGISLIGWQLRLFEHIEDIRVVVGFQALDVIEEVLRYRPDAIFVYNHNYFETMTGTSFYLGAKDANEYVLAYDGDLLVHPDDMKQCLSREDEYIAYSDKMSDDAVFVRTNEAGEVLSFSRKDGDYEWTGPARVAKSKIMYTSGSVYSQLEPLLPMPGLKIRACDIDTYDDYQRAIDFVSSWRIG